VIFIDASAIVGRLVARDQNHAVALAFWDQLATAAMPCYSSNLVMGEALTLVARRTSYRFAAEQARELYSSRVLQILRPVQADEIAAIALFAKFADQQISFVDCVSFALMRRRGISNVFGFDRHFASAGFTLKP
jgi:predicted nucleic acid-binding protein